MLDIRAEIEYDNVLIDDLNRDGALIVNTTPCLSLSKICAIDPMRFDGMFAMEDMVKTIT